MKKAYIIPELVVVKLATQQMLASSPLGIAPGDADPASADSRGYDFEDY